MVLLKFVLATCLIGLSAAEIVNFQACPESADSCQIHEVRINPCPEAAEGAACKIKKGNSANIAFDYTPNFNATSAKGEVFWASEVDLPLLGMDTDGCKCTQCPITKGQKQTYTIDLPIGRKFPARSYDIKWKLYNEADTSELCCFITYIRLTK